MNEIEDNVREKYGPCPICGGYSDKPLREIHPFDDTIPDFSMCTICLHDASIHHEAPRKDRDSRTEHNKDE